MPSAESERKLLINPENNEMGFNSWASSQQILHFSLQHELFTLVIRMCYLSNHEAFRMWGEWMQRKIGMDYNAFPDLCSLSGRITCQNWRTEMNANGSTKDQADLGCWNTSPQLIKSAITASYSQESRDSWPEPWILFLPIQAWIRQKMVKEVSIPTVTFGHVDEDSVALPLFLDELNST